MRELLALDPAVVNVKDGEGATALHYATMNGHREIVGLLLAGGADINARDDRFDATPTGWAIEYLRESGGLLAVEIEDVLYAIRENDVRWVRRLLTRSPALQAFQPIVKWLQGKALPLDLSAEVLIHAGMRNRLEILWQQQDVQTLVESPQKLATRHPEEIYGFGAEVLKTGTKIEQKRLKDELRNRTRPFGFAAGRKKSD